MSDALRGNFPARIDDKGRLKVPTAFRTLLEAQYGAAVFVTSLNGDCVRIYPLPVWVEIEGKLDRMPSTHPARAKFLDRVNFYGQNGELDKQGRVLIPARLRELTGMSGEVAVLGQMNRLDVWNTERFLTKLEREEYTAADALALTDYGI